MSITNKIAYKRRVLKKSQLTTTQKHGRLLVIALVLLGAIIGASYMFLYEELNKSKVVMISIAEAKEVSGVARELNQRTNASQEEIMPRKIDGDVVASLIRQTFPECPEMAVSVAMCESSLDPSRIGDTHMAHYSFGLYQINQTWHKYSKETLLDPVENIKIARKIYDESGGNWNRWTCGRKLANQSI